MDFNKVDVNESAVRQPTDTTIIANVQPQSFLFILKRRYHHDLKKDGEKAGTISNMPLLIDFNFHLLKGKKLYVGVTAGYAYWGDAKDVPMGDNGEPGTVTVNQTFVYGLNLGYDFHLGDTWAILTNVRYLAQKVEPDMSGASDLSVNPIVANVGLAYRF